MKPITTPSRPQILHGKGSECQDESFETSELAMTAVLTVPLLTLNMVMFPIELLQIMASDFGYVLCR